MVQHENEVRFYSNVLLHFLHQKNIPEWSHFYLINNW